MNKTFSLSNSDALLITDIQNDFLPGGALPIKDGDEIIPVLNEYAKLFCDAKLQVFASRDWHPPNHCSFKKQGGSWPPHCIQNTKGARFSSDLQLPQTAIVISKATDPNIEAYSVFDGTNFNEQLKAYRVKRLFLGGLATDYCIVNTAVDALKLGFETVVLMDATLGIDVNPGDVDHAIDKMLKLGAQQVTTDNFPDVVDALPMGEAEPDVLEERPSERATANKKARLRSRGSVKRLPTERKS